MIIIRIYGLDPYLTGKLSAELTPNLAKLFETDEDEISFIAEDDLYFHKGFDQNSWNAYVEVHVPEKYHEFKEIQDEVANLISVGIGENIINLAIEFTFFHEDHVYERHNNDYPRFIESNNSVDLDGCYEDEMDDLADDDDCCDHDHREEGEGDDEIYTGDIFKDTKLD